MKKITIETMNVSHLQSINDLQTAYTAVYPDAPVIPGDIYLSPAFDGGRNLFCAMDESGSLLGYAPLYPVLMRDSSERPHTLWTEVKAHPILEASDEVKDLLMKEITLCAREVTSEFPGHPIHLTFQYFPSEIASIAYVQSKGCQHTESVFTMRRDLMQVIPNPCVVEDIVMRPWKMESETEQQMYMDVRNQCFPEAPIELGEWQYFMQSPMWSVGTTCAAFHGEQLVGNTAIFWNEAENVQTGKKIGFTEYIFVHPDWRSKNIARELITRGLKYLQEHGLQEARLEVKAQNQNALRLYHNLGFEVIGESRFYVLSL